MLSADHENLCDLLASGETVKAAAGTLMLATSSLYDARDRLPEFRAAMDAAQIAGRPIRLKRSAAKRAEGRKARDEAARAAAAVPKPESPESLALQAEFREDFADLLPDGMHRSPELLHRVAVRRWRAGEAWKQPQLTAEGLGELSARCAAEFAEDPEPSDDVAARFPIDLADIPGLGKRFPAVHDRYVRFIMEIRALYREEEGDGLPTATLSATRARRAVDEWEAGEPWSDVYLDQDQIRNISKRAAISYCAWWRQQE